ncbi:ROK family transcriptional regulator [Streptomyces sp. NPDC057486]|uniref:ROK family transcriptional regulator n=1 Tax=Streptomyces sp. NPDC057486 TaxID=3346145 RepID=UPI00367F3D75
MPSTSPSLPGSPSPMPFGAAPVLRSLNEWSVAAHLLDAGPLTRVELAERTGLALPTVGRAVASLEQSGLAARTGQDTSRKGPAALLYGIEPQDGGLYAALVVTPLDLRLTLHTMRGERLALAQTPAEALPAGAPLEIQVQALANRALARAGTTRDRIWHTVISVPTIVDGDGRVRRDLPSPLPHFDQEAIDAIRTDLGPDAAVTVENDVNLAALGERAQGAARGLDDFVYLHVSQGIGMGIVMHGELHRGARGAAGEVSRMPMAGIHPHGPRERELGPLQLALGPTAFTARLTAHGLPADTLPATVFEAAARGDQTCTEIVQAHATALAQALAGIDAVLDPALIVLGGDLAGHPDLLPPLRTALGALGPRVPEVTTSTLGPDAVLRGAEAVAAAQVREELFRRITGA